MSTSHSAFVCFESPASLPLSQGPPWLRWGHPRPALPSLGLLVARHRHYANLGFLHTCGLHAQRLTIISETNAMQPTGDHMATRTCLVEHTASRSAFVQVTTSYPKNRAQDENATNLAVNEVLHSTKSRVVLISFYTHLNYRCRSGLVELTLRGACVSTQDLSD